MSQFDHSTQIQKLLDLVSAGDEKARDELIRHSFERLRALARQMFHRQEALRQVVQTDDVLQGAAVRLHRALPEVKPDSVRRFFGLAAQQIRRELIDLARRHLGEEGEKIRQVSYLGAGGSRDRRILEQKEAPSAEPEDVLAWAEFHEAINALPEEEHEVVNLLFYQGMQQAEAASVLGISVRQVKRIWQRAKLLLAETLHGDWPEM